MNIPGFTTESLRFAENLLGKCNQKKLREQNKQPRTPAQEQADQARSQALKGKPAATQGGARTEAAKKAAETRSKCKGGGSSPATPIA
jgi:hypothetical protein